MTRHLTLILTLAVIAAPCAAEAQTTAWGKSGYISFNGMFETLTSTSETAGTLTINQEPARINTTLALPSGLVYDVTVGGRIKGNLGIGFGFAYLKRTRDDHVTGSVPHPFYFDRPRTLDTTAPLDHEDFAVHMQAMWLLPVSETFHLALFAGPTYFRIRQQSITGATTDEVFPFDTVRLASLSTTRERAAAWGFNAGLDASHFFSRHVGAGGLMRFSRGSGRLSEAGGDSSTVKVGGLQVGAGIRVRY